MACYKFFSRFSIAFCLSLAFLTHTEASWLRRHQHSTYTITTFCRPNGIVKLLFVDELPHDTTYHTAPVYTNTSAPEPQPAITLYEPKTIVITKITRPSGVVELVLIDEYLPPTIVPSTLVVAHTPTAIPSSTITAVNSS
jgi:hypothetical protein